MRSFFSLALLSVALLSCARDPTKTERVRPPCTEFGQQCEVAPGKLGSCVLRENCVGEGCFVCQSQH